MITEFLFANAFFFTGIFIAGILLIVSMSGFIGNININTGDGNINISGADAEMDFVEEAVEKMDSVNVTDMLINNPVGDVKVSDSGDNSVTLKKKLYVPKATSNEEIKRTKELFNQPVLKINGNTLELNVPKIAVLGVMSPKINLEVSVPRALNVKQTAGVNDITLEDIDGNVELQNNVGNITLKRLNGAVSVHTNSGSINAHELKKISSLSANAGNITASSIDVPAGKSSIISHVGNLEVDINDVDAGSDCEIKSNTGGAVLMINRQANVSLEAITNMGQLDVDPNINVVSRGQSFMGGSVSAVVNQPGGKVSVSSNTGAVSVKLK